MCEIYSKPKDSKEFKCDYNLCENSFNTIYELMEHKYRAHLKREFVCDWPKCGKQFRTNTQLIEHSAKHSSLLCGFDGCLAQLLSKEDLDKHLVDVHNIIVFHICSEPNCYYETEYEIELKRHQMSEHWNESRNSEQNLEFVCDFANCSAQLTNMYGLQQHKKRVHNKLKLYICSQPNCSYKTNVPYSLKVHKLNRHSINMSIDECRQIRKNYRKCYETQVNSDTTEESLSSKNESNNENQLRTDSEQVLSNVWPDSQLTTNQTTALNSDKPIDGNKYNYCSECGKRFITSDALEKHSIIHRIKTDSNLLKTRINYGFK